ncbi:MAG: hypothetical protein ACM3Y9_12325 [Ignavibacteria bacterium]
MRFPEFFAAVPPLRVRDPLACFLGAADEGILEYGYVDAVKLAGHSCPTVAAAFGMTRAALAALYGEEMPERGGIAVALRDAVDTAATGVVGAVAGLLTGAAGDGGFKGLGGRFGRRNLLSFGARLPLEARFTRLDTGAAVDAGIDLSSVQPPAGLAPAMPRAISGDATPEELARFGELWQERVRRILLEHLDDPAVFIVRTAAGAA